LAAGPGNVQVVDTSVDPTAIFCGAGRVTQPFEVALEQPAAPEIVQLQILVNWDGRFVVRAAQVVPVVELQFLPV
jgi:hypothetical protein